MPKNGKSHFGYNPHMIMDTDYDLIQSIETTTANVLTPDGMKLGVGPARTYLKGNFTSWFTKIEETGGKY